jgi:cytochrome c oxidase cbb3-type subunit 3
LQAANVGKSEVETELVVQLAHSADVDLDLYVTDPLLETVYFANKTGKSGGTISADSRCDTALPEDRQLHIEEVRFSAPLSGHYRVGVDYPNRCDANGATGFEDRAAYSLSVLHLGERQNVQGSVGYRFYELAAFDFEIGASTAASTSIGKALFKTHCQSCHGANGDGKGPATKAMYLNPRSFVVTAFKFDTDADWRRGTDTDIANVIKDGAEAFGGSELMPAWGQILSDEEIGELVAYIRTLENKVTPPQTKRY